MKIVYACTYVEKIATDWSPDEGADPDTMRTIICERCHVVADTLPGLIEAIGKRFFLDIDDVFIPDEDEDGQINRIGYNRIEDGDSNEADDREVSPVYLCDYSFAVEKRTVEPIPLAEFAATGIKYHD